MRELRVLVCDEADNLLDMGFKPTIVKILQNLPPKDVRQALLFSATFPADVKDLAKFALKVCAPELLLHGSSCCMCAVLVGSCDVGHVPRGIICPAPGKSDAQER